MRILVNTISTKKHSGGAFQIANNYTIETLKHPEIDWIYVVSSDLDASLPNEIKKQSNYFVFPTQPDFFRSYYKVKKELKKLVKKTKPDVVYSITAPCYFSFEVPEVMRFTNPLVAHPNKYSWLVQPLGAKLRLLLYCWNQKRLIKNARYLITQTETTKQGILRITHLPENHVRVVNNVLPASFASQSNKHINNDSWREVACVGAPVPHKNFDIIPEVLRELKNNRINDVRFHITMPENHIIWIKIQKKLREYHLESLVINHGRLNQAELSDMYKHCQYCFLPTLLEVFSASTVEAMFYDLKIVATNFSFNKEVLKDSCLYYAPMNPIDAAKQFMRLFNDKELQESLSNNMRKQLKKYDNYEKHFNEILSFLIDVAEKKI